MLPSYLMTKESSEEYLEKCLSLPLDEDGEPIPTDEPRVSVNQQMIDEHHAVEYTGESKDTTTERHLEHRKLLLEKGTVTQEQIDEVL